MDIIYRHFETLGSTNDWGKMHLHTFPRNKMTLIYANSQLSGRGRYGRNWISPKEENIYASFCFFIDENQQNPLSLTHVLAISVSECLQAYSIDCQIKWPNDILVSGKKIAGILCETLHLTPFFGVVIGIGLNVNMTEESLDTVGQPATSILQETKIKYLPEKLLKEIATRFSDDLAIFLKRGFEPFFFAFRQRSVPTSKYQSIL